MNTNKSAGGRTTLNEYCNDLDFSRKQYKYWWDYHTMISKYPHYIPHPECTRREILLLL